MLCSPTRKRAASSAARSRGASCDADRGTDLVYRFPVELAALPHPLSAVFAAIRHAAVVGIDAEPQAASAHDDLVFIERTASEHPVDLRWDVLAAVSDRPLKLLGSGCAAYRPRFALRPMIGSPGATCGTGVAAGPCLEAPWAEVRTTVVRTRSIHRVARRPAATRSTNLCDNSA